MAAPSCHRHQSSVGGQVTLGLTRCLPLEDHLDSAPLPGAGCLGSGVPQHGSHGAALLMSCL